MSKELSRRLPTMRFVSCTRDEHASAMLCLFNEAIANSTALYDYHPRTPESMESWFKAKVIGRFPIIGAVNESNELLGFASYGTFRAWPAYKYSVEHSVYVHHHYRRSGIGCALMNQLISAAIGQQYHIMVGGIDAANSTSIALHERLGFVHSGTIRQAGFKFGRWLDLAFYQLTLPTPNEPTDG